MIELILISASSFLGGMIFTSVTYGIYNYVQERDMRRRMENIYNEYKNLREE